ncbi:MAG: hypothetical protein OHK0046_16480 [Anaerolineae bacterium]
MGMNDQVLYIGSRDDTAVHPDWFVAGDVQEALAMYVFYMPQVTIFDAAFPVA